MALTAVITKASVKKLTSHDYQVKIKATITDETATVLLEKNYSTRWYSSIDIDSIKVKLQTKLKDDWDEYVAEKAKYDAAAFGTMVSEIQIATNNYINL